MRHIKTLQLEEGMLHVETPLGIVNIRVGLTDLAGHPIDSIVVLPDEDVRRAGLANTRLVGNGAAAGGMHSLKPVMKLLELLNTANQGYPNGYLAEYYDTRTGERKSGSGDTLAQFVVVELTETFDPQADDEAHITEAVRALTRARTDLDRLISVLMTRRPSADSRGLAA